MFKGWKVYAHRVVMMDRLGGPLHPRQHVHHINGDTKDNRLENLRLMSDSEHHKETWRKGQVPAHSEAVRLKIARRGRISDESLRGIWHMLKEGVGSGDIGLLFHISQQCVSNIKHGWSHSLRVRELGLL